MLEYFNIHKLKLAGYSVGNHTIEIETVFESLKSTSSVYDPITRKLMCKTISHQENEVKSCFIMAQTRCTKAEIGKAFDELAALKLGIVKIKKADNHRDYKVFHKIPKAELLEDINFPQKLSLFGMTVEQFKSEFFDENDDSQSKEVQSKIVINSEQNESNQIVYETIKPNELKLASSSSKNLKQEFPGKNLNFNYF